MGLRVINTSSLQRPALAGAAGIRPSRRRHEVTRWIVSPCSAGDWLASARADHDGRDRRRSEHGNDQTNDEAMLTTSAPGFLDQYLDRLGSEGIVQLPDNRLGHASSLRWYYEDSIITMRRVNKGDSVALYDVVAAEIRRAIADGEAGPGERMPRAIDLAAILGVNKNTVIRAIHLLRDEGLLDFTRGRGVRVVGTPQKSALMTRIDELLDFARSQGYKREEVAALVAGQE